MSVNRSALVIEFLWFCAAGSIGTALHYAVLIGIVITLKMPNFGSALGFMAGAITNYLLNYRYTFASNRPHREAFVKFLAIAAIGLGLNTMIMAVGVSLLHFHYLLAQVSATGAVVFWNFAGNRLWTFGK